MTAIQTRLLPATVNMMTEEKKRIKISEFRKVFFFLGLFISNEFSSVRIGIQTSHLTELFDYYYFDNRWFNLSLEINLSSNISIV